MLIAHTAGLTPQQRANISQKRSEDAKAQWARMTSEEKSRILETRHQARLKRKCLGSDTGNH